MWVLYARVPKGVRKVAWRPIAPAGMLSRGNSARDVWWMAFRTRAAADRGRALFRSTNAGQPMILSVRSATRVPV